MSLLHKQVLPFPPIVAYLITSKFKNWLYLIEESIKPALVWVHVVGGDGEIVDVGCR